jgi:CDP-paratose 2-epimerase
MSVAIVTGSAGLVGSESVRFFAEQGFDIAGIDNDMRGQFFGPEASTGWNLERLQRDIPAYTHFVVDIRDAGAVDAVFAKYGSDVALVIHAAAQPSHDWAAREPVTDFSVNATGTLVLLEATRQHCPDAVFIFTSTNKVYGDTPNRLPFRELATRYDLPAEHEYAKGIDENMSIDHTLHSVFGASKVAADVMVQEYGRYFDLRTGTFRGGCLTGQSHSGTELHGFLAYLMKCTVAGQPYRVFGYKGKQVRDNIHSTDLVKAFHAFFQKPRAGEVYNIGGGRASNCSMLEGIALCEQISGRRLEWEYVDQARMGDHQWWISDLAKFKAHYPQWDIRMNVEMILQEIFEANEERWMAASR